MMQAMSRIVWVSAEAIQQAHGDPAVLKLWEQYSVVCDYVPLTDVPEAANRFSEFAPLTVHA
jgi:hypothetical protein